MKHKTSQVGAPEVLPPGEFLKEELDARGWSQVDFAAILGRPPRLVNEIIKAKRAITPETALSIGEALGTGPELWMNLESTYRLSLVRIKGNLITRRAQVFGKFRVRELQKRGWIPEADDLEVLERNLLSFLSLNSLDAEFSIPHAAKRTSYDGVSVQQAAWLARARQISARLQVAGEFSISAMPNLYGKLRSCVEEVGALTKIPEILSASGIRIVVVEPLPASKIDGACFWLTPTEPVIALSLRFDRHDIFCHALWHELDHIEHNEGQAVGMLDVNMLSPTGDEMTRYIEERANKNAAACLIPTAELESLIASADGAYSEARLTQFAKKLSVHPGIVLGQLQHRGVLPWSAYAHFRSRVRDVITRSAPTDGFGVHVT